MFGKSIKTIASIMLLAIMLMSFASLAFAAGPNTGWVTHPTWFNYIGNVQFQPSYTESGNMHAIQGYVRFTGGATADSGRQWSRRATSTYDTMIYSHSYNYLDTLDPKAPQTTFNYGHSYVGNVGILRVPLTDQ